MDVATQTTAADLATFRRACDEAIARAVGDDQRVAELTIAREFFCDPAFRAALSESTWNALNNGG